MWGSKVAVTTDHQDPQMLGKLSGEFVEGNGAHAVTV